MKYTLVLLTLDEIDGLKHVYPLIPDKHKLEIIAVDGGSTDGTLDFYKKHKIKVVQQVAKGRGEGFRIGMKEAKGDVVIFFSPDGNENPKDIPKFASYFEQDPSLDMVIASRMMRGAFNEENSQFFKPRKWVNNIFNLCANVFFRKNGSYITDSINGFRAIRKSSFNKLKPKSLKHTIEYEMTIKAFKQRMKIIEFPTYEGARVGGYIKAKSIPTGLDFVRLLLLEILESIRKNIHLVVLMAIILFSIFIRFQGIYWNIKENPNFQYSIHVDEIAKIDSTLALDLKVNKMHPPMWLMQKGAGYPNIAKILFDVTNNNIGSTIFKSIYGYDLNSMEGLYLFFRSITAVFSIILITVTYKITTLVSNNKYASILSAFLFSTIFGSLFSSIIFKSDIVVTTFLTIMLYFLIKYLKTKSIKTFYLAGIFLGFSIATKYSAFFAGLIFPLIWLFEYIKYRKLNIRLYANVIMITIVSIFLLSPFMFLDLQNLKQGFEIQKYYQTTRSFHFEEYGIQLFAVIWHLLFTSINPPFTLLGIVSFAFALFQAIAKKQIYLLPIIIFIIIIFSLSSMNTWIVVRYTIPMYPVICTLVSLLIIKIIESIKNKGLFYKYSIFVILGFLITYHFLYFMAFSKFITTTTTTVQAANWINSNIAKENPGILQLQLLGSEPPLVYGITNKVFLFSGKNLDTLINNNDGINDIETDEKINYIILDERSFRQFYRLKADKYEVYRKFFDSIMKSDDYELIKKFEIKPEFLGVKFDEGFLPQDIILASPDILIYKRK